MSKNLYKSIKKVDFLTLLSIITIAFLLLFGLFKVLRYCDFELFNSNRYTNLSSSVEYFLPPNDQNPDIDEIANNSDDTFKNGNFRSIYFSQDFGKVWLKLKLHGDQTEINNLLFFDCQFIKNINFYIPSTDGKFICVKPKEYFIFPYINFPKNTDFNRNIYINLDWTENSFNLLLAKDSDFYISQNWLTYFYIGTLGIIFGLAIMNIILFISSKDKKYLFHSFFTGSMLALLYCLSGTQRQIFGFTSDNNLITLVALVSLSWVLFLYSYLDIENNLPKLKSLFKFSIILLLLCLYVSQLIPNGFTYGILFLFMLVTGTCIFIAVYSYFKFKKGSIYYLIGKLVLFSGAALYLLATSGLLEWSPLTFNALYIAATIETLLFTVGIIKQIKTERKRNDILKIETVTDKLTNLYNRRYFDETVKIKINELELKKCAVSMLILDIDHFKNINDNYGHSAGDSVLSEISVITKHCLKEEDILIRWGGEEFVVILPFKNIEEGTVISEKIRRTIENNIFKYVGKATVSIGIAEKAFEESFENLFNRVDGAMYRAKEGGRNRVCISYGNGIPIRMRWNKVFESSNLEIDSQHKDLINQMNYLIENYYCNYIEEEFFDRFNNLSDSIIAHFKFEEDILSKINYPDFNEHNLTHKKIADDILEIKRILIKKEINSKLLNKFLIANPIINHMLSDDINYFKYLNSSTDL